jgi:hypothetical protein
MSNARLITVRVKKDKRYYALCLDAIEDQRLSWKAKGLHTYLVSRPDGWKIRINDLLNRASGGKSQILSAVKELKKYKWLTITRERDETGRYSEDGTTWTVVERLEKDVLPQSENRDMGKRNVENPYDGKSAPIINTNKDLVITTTTTGVVVDEKQKNETARFVTFINIKARLAASTFSVNEQRLKKMVGQYGLGAVSDALDIALYNSSRVDVSRPEGLLKALTERSLNGSLERPAGFIFTREKLEQQSKDVAKKAGLKTLTKEDLVCPDEFKKGVAEVLGRKD